MYPILMVDILDIFSAVGICWVGLPGGHGVGLV
jgi:hypothetical protein